MERLTSTERMAVIDAIRQAMKVYSDLLDQDDVGSPEDRRTWKFRLSRLESALPKLGAASQQQATGATRRVRRGMRRFSVERVSVGR